MSRSVGQVSGSAANGKISMLSDDNMARVRRTRRTRDGLRELLLESALVEFAAKGFDGASTRAIAERADAHQPQINYHFTSKEALWDAAVDHLFRSLVSAFADLPALNSTRDPVELGRAVAEMLRRFVRFAAEHPELNRIMVQEAMDDSDRLHLIENHVRPWYDATTAAWERLRDAGTAAPIEAASVYWVIVGAASIAFVNAPEVRLLAGAEPTNAAWVETHAAGIVATLLPGLPGSPIGVAQCQRKEQPARTSRRAT
jgi:TetR/AcrR family transcriptional regulator